MDKNKRAPSDGDQKLTLVLSRTETEQILAVLKHTEGLAGLLDPNGRQNFLGKLIKKIGGVVKRSKPAAP